MVVGVAMFVVMFHEDVTNRTALGLFEREREKGTLYTLPVERAG